MTIEISNVQQLDDGDSKHMGLFGAKVDPFSMTEISNALPRCPSSVGRLSFPPSRVENYQSSYDDRGCDSGKSTAEWDEYWYPCDSESSDLSQSATSFMSWTDEVEEETTKKVQEMYDAAERFLYDEGSPRTLSVELADECLQWKSRFKHLRVVGVAIQPSPSSPLDQSEETLESLSSDDEEGPSYVEISDETDCLKYDDVLMGSKREEQQSVLREKVADLVAEGLFAHVWPKVEQIVSRKVETTRETSLPSVSESRMFGRLVVDETLRTERCAPLEMRLERPVVESRAYHSAFNRQAADNPASVRRLSSLSTRGGQQGTARQEEILRSLREEQDKALLGPRQPQLSVLGSGCRPRSNVTLPPINSPHRGPVQAKRKAGPASSVDPLSLPAAFQVHGTGMSRLQVAQRIAQSRADKTQRANNR